MKKSLLDDHKRQRTNRPHLVFTVFTAIFPFLDILYAVGFTYILASVDSIFLNVQGIKLTTILSIFYAISDGSAQVCKSCIPWI
jgi:hypothetical protein